MKYTTILNGETYEVDIQPDGSVLLNGEEYDVDFMALEESLFSLIQNTKSFELAIEENRGMYQILLEGRLYEAQVLDQRALLMAQRKGTLLSGSGEV
ncbi:MAG: hypothetical protein AAF126_15235, partial [Chloroflexota bacterium]